MNRRQVFKGIFGVAVATALPTMPFVWNESEMTRLFLAMASLPKPDIMVVPQEVFDHFFSETTPESELGSSSMAAVNTEMDRAASDFWGLTAS